MFVSQLENDLAQDMNSYPRPERADIYRLAHYGNLFGCLSRTNTIINKEPLRHILSASFSNGLYCPIMITGIKVHLKKNSQKYSTPALESRLKYKNC